MTLDLKTQNSVWLVVVIGSILTVLIVNALLNPATVTVQTTGTVKTFGVDVDVTFINWTEIEPGETKNYTIHMRPSGSEAATLALNTSSWDPANASEYMTLTWNYTGEVLQPGVWVPIELYLYVAADIKGIKTFYFDIIISAEA